jgi:hypothetical protein
MMVPSLVALVLFALYPPKRYFRQSLTSHLTEQQYREKPPRIETRCAKF